MTELLDRYKLPLVILLALAIRLTALLAFPQVFAFDQTGVIHGSAAYDEYAQNLLATGVYGRIEVLPTAAQVTRSPDYALTGIRDLFTPHYRPDAAIPPLYSYALAGVYSLFGRGYLQVGLFHSLLDCLSIAMIYHIGKRLFPLGDWVGALAGLFYAGYPYLIFQNLTLIDTPFFMFWLNAFVLLMVLLRGRERFDLGTLGWAVLGGLVLGFSVLTRPITPPLALLVALWFLFRRSLGQTILRLLPVALLSAAVLAPWILRNYQVFHAFVPMTTTSGANFWQGNSPYTIPYFRAGYDVQWTAPDLTTEDLNSREADAERFAQAFQWLRDNPGKIPELLWVKFWVYWSVDVTPRLNPTEGQLPRVNYQGDVISSDDDGALALGGLPPGDPVGLYSSTLFDQIGRTVHRFYWGGLLLLALIGLWRSRWLWREVSLLWFVQLSMTLVYLVFHPSTRYRVPTDPLLFLFSAYTLVALAMWWRNRRRDRPPEVQWETW